MEHLKHVINRMNPSTPPGAASTTAEGTVQFFHSAEHAGWLWKQGEHIRTWRKRWFVLKHGKLAWFKDANVTSQSIPRGVIELRRCLSVRGATDALNSSCAFEVATQQRSMFFIAESEDERGQWINALGKVCLLLSHHSSLSAAAGSHCPFIRVASVWKILYANAEPRYVIIFFLLASFYNIRLLKLGQIQAVRVQESVEGNGTQLQQHYVTMYGHKSSTHPPCEALSDTGCLLQSAKTDIAGSQILCWTAKNSYLILYCARYRWCNRLRLRFFFPNLRPIYLLRQTV